MVPVIKNLAAGMRGRKNVGVVAMRDSDVAKERRVLHPFFHAVTAEWAEVTRDQILWKRGVRKGDVAARVGAHALVVHSFLPCQAA